MRVRVGDRHVLIPSSPAWRISQSPRGKPGRRAMPVSGGQPLAELALLTNEPLPSMFLTLWPKIRTARGFFDRQGNRC
jgi:hypothetical protein